MAAVVFLLALLFAGRSFLDRPEVTPAAAVVPEPPATAAAAPIARKQTVSAAPKNKKTKKKATKREPAVFVAPEEFHVRDVRVEDAAYRVTIRGAVWLDRRGVIAQPLLRYVLRDRDGAVVRTGDFTPADAAGPLWIGFGYDGLKAVPFTLDLDLRASTPGRAPRAPLSATVRPVAVVDAKVR